MKTFLFTCLFLVMGGIAVQAQSYRFSAGQDLWWVNLGIGIGNISTDNENLLLFVSFNKPRTETLLLTGRYTYSRQLDVFESVEPEKNWDISGLVSYYTKGEAGFFSIGAGLGLSGGKIRDPQLQNYLTIGLPIEMQMFVTLPAAGLGLVGIANINPKTTYWGAGVSLQFGTLR